MVLGLSAWPMVGGCASDRMISVRPPTIGRPVAKIDPEEAAVRLVQEHNQIRLREKLTSLSVSSRLDAAAKSHALEMAARGKTTHTGADGSSPAERVERAGYAYRRTAENVAAGQFSVEEVMSGWMNSPGHRKNILGSFSQIGTACATGEDGTTYWCVTFGTAKR